MNIKEVKNKKDNKIFLELPIAIYKNDPNWIRPLDVDIEKVFDPKINKLYRDGKAVRFLLFDSSGDCIGRVAAFYSKKLGLKQDQPTGGMGFFECINNQDAANLLFETCINWLKAEGKEAMDGPVNFGERNNWWGLLVEGFTPPNYSCNYNPKYYQALFENFGFQTFFNQYTYYLSLDKPLSDSINEKALRVFANKEYHFEHMKLKNWEKYAEDFKEVYNQAWVKHGVPKLESRQAKLIMKTMKPVIDEEIVWFAYYKERPVAFFIMLPELNQLFKYVNGKLDLIGKLKFAYYRWRGACTKMFGVVFGVVPDQQGKGLPGAIVRKVGDLVLVENFRYKEFEMNWIGDFNPSMMKLSEEVGGEVSKVHKTYRYLFDRNKEFKRHPILK